MRSRLRILSVEDHFLTRLAISTLITDQPDMQLVAQAETGVEAVRLYDVHRPDLVLMDLRLPELDGIEATRRICTAHTGARILILSHHEGDEDVARALAAGARGYAKKDASGPSLLEAIRAVGAGRRHVPAALAEKAADRNPRAALTPRELEILRLVFEGLANKEIATRLGIGEGTVRIHVSNLLLKLGVRRRTEAIAVALKKGLLQSG